MTEDVNKNKEQQEEVDTTVATETSTEESEGEETVDTEETVAETEEASEEVEETEETTEEEESIEESVPTFTGEVDGKTYTFDQLQAASEDYTDEEFHELAGMYENTLSEIEEKEIVTGIVVSVDEKYVIVDIGFKSEGIVQANEFSDKVLENLAYSIFKAFKSYKRRIDSKSVSLSQKRDDKISYKLQIASSKNPIAKDSDYFKDYDNIEEHKIENKYKYTIGNFRKYDKAVEMKKEIKKDFPGAFVVAFRNKKPISVNKAIKLTEK